MCSADSYAWCMARIIQIRNVPEALHRRLKSRAALEGKSLSDYLLAELRRMAERPSLAELRERLEKRPATDPRPSPEEAIRAEHGAR
jgi:antitoxin FitA